MTILKSFFVSWRRMPLFRHYFLWSYRFDFFLLLVGAYVLIGGLVLVPYLYANALTHTKLKSPMAAFKNHHEALVGLVAKQKTSPQANDSVAGITLFDSQNKEIQQYQHLADDAVRRIWRRFTPPTDATSEKINDPVLEKIRDWMTLKYFTIFELRNSYTRLGSVASNPVFLILVSLPIALMAFSIWNVFHTRDIEFVSRHPQFSILFGQLLVLMFVPIAIGGVLELCSQDTMTSVTSSGILEGLPGLPSPIWEDNYYAMTRYGPIKDLATSLTTTSEDNVFISDVGVILVTLIGWIAAGLWIVRYFGGGVFLACSTIAAAIVALILIALPDQAFFGQLKNGWSLDLYLFSFGIRDFDFAYRLIVAILVLGAIFIIGLRVGRFSEYFLCTGFLGVLVLLCLAASLTVALSTISLISYGYMLLIIIAWAAVVEFALRKSMSRFLYDPR